MCRIIVNVKKCYSVDKRRNSQANNKSVFSQQEKHKMTPPTMYEYIESLQISLEKSLDV